MSKLDAKKKSEAKAKLESEKERQLKKTIFSSDEGKELLELWKEYYLVNMPSQAQGNDLFALGHAEGIKFFVRSLVHFQKQSAEGLL